MTTIAVPIVPTTADASLSRVTVESDRLDGLYEAMAADVLDAVIESGGDPILALPSADEDGDRRARDMAEAICADAGTSFADVPVVRVAWGARRPAYSSILRAVREQSEAASVAIVDSRTPLIERRHLDAAAMRLRRDDIAIGPTPAGEWYYFGTSLPAAAMPNRLDRHLHEAVAAGAAEDRTIGVLDLLPAIETDRDLHGIHVIIASMERVGRAIAPSTARWLDRHDLGTISAGSTAIDTS